MKGRIETILFSTVGALTLLLVAGAGYEVARLNGVRHAAEDAASRNDVGDLLLQAAGQWAVERGATTGFLNAPDPVATDRRLEIIVRRSAGDAALQNALVKLQGRGHGDDDRLISTMQQDFVRLRELRRAVDDDLARPRAARDPALLRDWFPTATRLIEASQRLRVAAEFNGDNVDSRLAQLQMLKHYAWVMSEYAGRERAQITAAIAAQTPLSLAQLQDLMAWRGRVDVAWDAIEDIRAKRSTPPEIAAEIGLVGRAFFGDFQQLRKAIYAAGGAAAPYPISASGWFARSTAAIDTILHLSVVGGNAADALAAQSARSSLYSVVVGLGVGLLGLCVGVAGLRIVSRRVVRPLRAMTDAMTLLATGDIAAEVPNIGRNDEIGEMAAAAQFFKKHMSAVTQRSELRLQAVVDHAADGLINIDEHGVVESFNPACERIFGYSAAEVIGQNVKLLMPEPEGDRHDRHIGRYLATGDSHIIGTTGREVQARRKDGSVFPIDLAISAFALPDGRHFCGIVRDITERKKAEATVALLASIVAASDDAIVSKSLDGIITSWNAGAERIFGYSAEEAVGQHIGMLIPTERAGEEREIVDQVRARNSIDHYETVRIAKDGRHISNSASVAPIRDWTGQVAGLSIIARDVTARKQHEAELARHVAALERSNKELDDFAYIASHDLKEPLRGLFNNAKFLHEDYADKLDQEGVNRLTRLGYLCQRMEQLVNDLLYFSRLGRQELAIKPTDLNEVIRDIESMGETTFKERNATIVIPIPLPRITCDKTRITEVFRNLIVNAVKYNDNAEKRVEIGYCDEVKTKTGVERCVFYVRDDGIGIAEEFHEDIFRIFKRLNAEDDDKKGTGVGLTFVRKIVERHGGRIWLESAPGNGTTFYFTIAQGVAYEAAA